MKKFVVIAVVMLIAINVAVTTALGDAWYNESVGYAMKYEHDVEDIINWWDYRHVNITIRRIGRSYTIVEFGFHYDDFVAYYGRIDCMVDGYNGRVFQMQGTVNWYDDEECYKVDESWNQGMINALETMDRNGWA